ncbi:hypothetical protein HPB50_007558 [Hyalomma asiaticum]|uniref:Uncharacterized protein n=1 Tax=Hyalomma asiaticum TaxID=266040 RepID=A0ACB7TDR7_HYAAI|nr:hypothetical protein HPB50_007558 [Hyalomma asiaticum]
MDPALHAGRRKARADYIDKRTKYVNTARFTDASPYQTDTTKAVAVITDHKGQITASASIDPATTTAAVELAIVLAMKEGWTRSVPLTIVTFSQKACGNNLKGQIGAQEHRILIGNGWDPTVKYIQALKWAPGQEGVAGNTHAHEADGGFTNNRASPDAAMEDPTLLDPCEAAILNYYREHGTLYPPPHSKLNVGEATTPRRLQTRTQTCTLSTSLPHGV